MSEFRICEVCGKQYKTCKSCEESYSKIYYTWRTHYCSSECCFVGFKMIENKEILMTVQAKGLTYGLKSYDLDKKDFVATNDLKIENDYVNAFLFYVVEDQEFVDIYKTKDKTNIKWQLTQLSITFKELFANE
jgi:hypothetical protein